MQGYRKNTMIIDFSVVPIRPSIPDIRGFVFDCLKIDMKQIKNLQLTHNNAYAYLEMESAALAEQLAADNNRKYFITAEKKEYAIPIRTADGAIEVKVKDLPPHLPNTTIAKHLTPYGEILSIKDDTWNEHFPGLPNCVRLVRMKLKKAIPSYIGVENETAYIRYKNQIATCKYCGRNLHIGTKCSEVRKALSVNNRLTLAEIVQGVNPDMAPTQTATPATPVPSIEKTVPASETTDQLDAPAKALESISTDATEGITSPKPGTSRKTQANHIVSDEASKKVNKTPDAGSPPFRGYDSLDGNVKNPHDRRDLSRTIVDADEGWREFSTKRPGSPGLAENSHIEVKRSSRSKNRTKNTAQK